MFPKYPEGPETLEEALKAKRAYASFTLKTVHRCLPALKDYLKRTPQSMLYAARSEFGIDFEALVSKDATPPPFHVFGLLCCAFGIEFAPGVLDAMEKKFITTASAAF